MRREVGFRVFGDSGLTQGFAAVLFLRVGCSQGGVGWVALRKESVDRNVKGFVAVVVAVRSLSARRAWIEITVSAFL